MFDGTIELSKDDQNKVNTLYSTYTQLVNLAAASIRETDYPYAAYKLDTSSLVIDGSYDDEPDVRRYLVRAIGKKWSATHGSNQDFQVDVLTKAKSKFIGIVRICPGVVYF